MTTLTDRYVWAVLRAVPEQQRAALEPEIRALIADAIEARATGPDAATTADAAERAALTELGDPEILAARYTDHALHLIGPRYFLVWKRLLLYLLPIIVPLSALANIVARATVGGADIGQLIWSGVSVAFTVTLQLVFCITLIFALVERAGGTPPEIGGAWTPDDLPTLPVPGRQHPFEVALSVAAVVILGAAIVWQQVAAPISVGGRSYPLVDPALWSFWLPWFLIVIALQVAVVVAAYRASRWTWRYAVAKAALSAAFAIPAVGLLLTGQLFDPAAVSALTTAGLGDALAPAAAVIAISVVVAPGWEAAGGLLDAWRGSRVPFAAGRP
jgi:hypothetical protein